jgi:hypothetical protein
MTEREKSTASDSGSEAPSLSNLVKPVGLEEPSLSEEQLQSIAEANQLFDQLCQQRHDKGREKYGTFTFIQMPTIEMAMGEVIDLANYARYTFIKLYLLQQQIEEIQQQGLADESGFISTTNLLGVKKL